MTDDVDVSREDLSDKQLELLEMNREDPEATQKEFAEELGSHLLQSEARYDRSRA